MTASTPVQCGFLANDALQCGFCTPGFVVEAVAFFDRWRRERGRERPSRQDIARALAGHLCRCGAYPGIYAAVADACAGLHDDGEATPQRPDALAKVTGEARYTFDRGLDALQARLVRSTIPHGELVALNPTKALAVEGAEAYVPLMQVGDRIRYHSQPVAAVAAKDEAAARAMAALVTVEIRPLPAAVGADRSLAEDAPDVHGWWIPPSNNEAPPMPGLRRKNRVGPVAPGSLNPRKVRRRLRRAHDGGGVLVEDRWETEVQSHTAFEPHCAVAEWTEEGRLVMHLSTQGVTPNRARLARELGLAEDRVDLIAEHVGGAFGAKQALGIEPVAAARLARQAGAPVRLALDRAEELTVGGNRPGTSVDLSMAATADGELEALRVRAVADGGASSGSLVASFLPRLIYPGAPRTLLDFDAVSNAPPGTAFRAPGGPPALFALEGAVDELAGQLNADPIDLRRSWNDRPLRAAMYDWAASHELWVDRRGPGTGRYRRGVGVAFGSWFNGHDPRVEVTVRAGPDGIEVSASAQDMGNGTRAMLGSAAAEAFGVESPLIAVRLGRSDLGTGPMSSGSRTTPSLWPAAYAAASEARKQLFDQARKHPDLIGAELAPGGLTHAGEHLRWDEVLPMVGPVEVTRRRPHDHRRITPFRHRVVGLEFGRGLTESAHIVDVEVDTRLGQVRVKRADTAIAAGRIHAPQLATSQVHGGVIQGLGMALHERRRIDGATGAVLSSTLEDYHLPGIADSPEMTVEFVEWGFEHLAGGGAGLSELALVAVPAAIAAATHHATGSRPRRLPIRPTDLVPA